MKSGRVVKIRIQLMFIAKHDGCGYQHKAGHFITKL